MTRRTDSLNRNQCAHPGRFEFYLLCVLRRHPLRKKRQGRTNKMCPAPEKAGRKTGCNPDIPLRGDPERACLSCERRDVASPQVLTISQVLENRLSKSAASGTLLGSSGARSFLLRPAAASDTHFAAANRFRGKTNGTQPSPLMGKQSRQIEQSYRLARERYASLGVDTDKALKTLARIPISIHCWQGDDVGGFENAGQELGGGLAA